MKIPRDDSQMSQANINMKMCNFKWCVLRAMVYDMEIALFEQNHNDIDKCICDKTGKLDTHCTLEEDKHSFLIRLCI